jgi:putative SOS response-associated peptidase YedK
MRWGLVPHWAPDAKGGFSTINARIETAAEKPAFRGPWQRRRCLVPANGYYEWVTDAQGHKQPFYLQPADEPLLMFAGLWDRWNAADGTPLLSFSIVTEAASGPIAALHHRRPLMLQAPQFADWLTAPSQALGPLLASAPRPALRWHAARCRMVERTMASAQRSRGKVGGREVAIVVERLWVANGWR